MDYLQNFWGKEQNIPSKTICFAIPPNKQTNKIYTVTSTIYSFVYFDLNW